MRLILNEMSHGLVASSEDAEEASEASTLLGRRQVEEAAREAAMREAMSAMQALGVSASAREVRLERGGLGPVAGRQVSALLRQRGLALPNEAGGLSFEILRLRTNALGAAGVSYLARSLAASPLIELDLAENSLGASGVRALCEAVGPTLERLDVSGNRCGPVGAEAVSAVATLRHVKCANNAIGDEGFASFGRASFGKLVLLDLRDNEATAVGVVALSKGFEANRTLTALDLRGNLISLEGFWCLGAAVHRRRRLHRAAERRRAHDFAVVPVKDRWRVIADASGWTKQDFHDLDTSKTLQARKNALVVPDRYRPRAPVDVHFFGLPITPRPLYNRCCGHHLLGALC